MKRRLILFNILIPIIIGTLIYYLFCPEVIFVKNSLFSIPKNPFITLVRNYLMDMLWSYALTFTIYLILDNWMQTFTIAALFSTTIELLQLTVVISGTFDILDIFAMLYSICLAILAIDYIKKRGIL